jgi:hypothetical protein
MKSSLGACKTLKDLDLKETVGSNSNSMISYRVLPGYESEEHIAEVKSICKGVVWLILGGCILYS